MRYKDPSLQVLKAATELLDDAVVYAGQVIYCGTRIPRNKKNYVQIYIEAIQNKNTGDSTIYDVTLAFQVVSIQASSEGDETPLNSIFEQVVARVDNAQNYVMTDFECVMAEFGDSEYNSELLDANYMITRKLRINLFIEQK